MITFVDSFIEIPFRLQFTAKKKMILLVINLLKKTKSCYKFSGNLYPVLAEKTALGLGFYVPEHVPWGPNNFINRDGSKVDFTNWGYMNFNPSDRREPAPGGEKATLFINYKSDI